MAGGAEAVESLQLCGQRQALTFRLHHQQHRQAQRIRQFPSAGTGGQALTIIKAHSALAHGGTMPGGIAGKNGPHHIPVGKKQIQIVAVHLQSRAVEHGVDVVRPAFERTWGRPRAFFSAASTAQATVVLPLPEEGAAMRNCIICVYP